jgi:hypothetical protein
MQLAPELLYDLCAWSVLIIGLPALATLAIVSRFSGHVPAFLAIVEEENKGRFL